jgi:hypothetical protein
MGRNARKTICRLYEPLESDDFRIAALINWTEHKQKEKQWSISRRMQFNIRFLFSKN